MVKSRRMRWAGHVAQMEKKNSYRILVGKLKNERPLRRTRLRWVGNTKIHLRKNGVVWTRLVWLRIGTRSEHF
jgi:hypothetical protein